MSSVIDELERLSTLHEKGALSDEEFAAAKQRILSDGPEEDSGEERELALAKAEQLMELGHIEYAEGNYDKALRCFQEALEIAREVGNKSSESFTLGNLGRVYQTQGQYEQAIELHTQAIDIGREIGNKHSESVHLGNLGNVYYSQGQYERAMEIFTQALDIARKIGNKFGEGINLGNLGNVHRAQGQYERAIQLYTQALDIAREIGDKRSKGVTLGNLGNVYYSQGQYERAMEIFTQALDIAREIGDKRSKGVTLGNLGDALFSLKRLDEAESAWRKAIPISDGTFPVGAGAFRGSLALLLAQQDQFKEAQSLLETGEAQIEPYPEEHAKFLAKKSQVCHLAGDADGARASLEQARALAAELTVGDETEVGQAIRELEAVLGGG
jgi:tetratricopeptide (TPR) repeat protein